MPEKLNRSSLLLVALAAILFACFIFYGFILPQTPARMEHHSATLVANVPLWSGVVSLPLPVPRTRQSVALAIELVGVIAFAAYGLALLALRSASGRATPPWVVFVPGVLFLVISVLQLPNVSSDIFNYIMRARLFTVYHANPYVVAGDAYPNDPLYAYAERRYTHWEGGKLPVWELMGGGLAKLAGEDPTRNLLVFRLAFFLLSLGNLALIYRILKRLAPDRALFGAAFYAWNPIVAVYAQSKTDTVMLFFLLLGVLSLVLGQSRRAMVALTLSVFVKLVTLPLVVIHWAREMRMSLARGLQLAVVGGIVVVVVYAPFWNGPALIAQQIGYMEGAVSSSSGLDIGRLLVAVALAGVVLWLGLARRGTLKGLINDWSMVMIVFALLVSKIGLSWYLTVPIGLFALAPSWRLHAAAVAIATWTFLLNTWRAAFSHSFPAAPPTHASQVWIVLVPTLILAFYLANKYATHMARERAFGERGEGA